MKKDFHNWHNIKSDINDNKKRPFFSEREVWWCSVGVNVGHEQDGKPNKKITDFMRPVIILKKLGPNLFVCVPLTTKIKDRDYYLKIKFKEREQSVLISQIKSLDAKRLTHRMGRLGKEKFRIIKQRVIDYISN